MHNLVTAVTYTSRYTIKHVTFVTSLGIPYDAIDSTFKRIIHNNHVQFYSTPVQYINLYQMRQQHVTMLHRMSVCGSSDIYS